jgi:hypothetical protein
MEGTRMLQINIPITQEGWDEEKQEFVEPKTQTLQLEHSLVSLSKWESKWRKPFLSANNKTEEETLDYIRCMTITENVDPDVYDHLSNENITAINKYIDSPMTATWFNEDKNGRRGNKNGKQITNELVYSWMISLNIPFDPCQSWHFNRLLTLIKVCDIEGQPSKNMSRKETLAQYRSLNKSRRAKHR